MNTEEIRTALEKIASGAYTKEGCYRLAMEALALLDGRGDGGETVPDAIDADPKASLTRNNLVMFVSMRGADGTPLLTTEEFWRYWPTTA